MSIITDKTSLLNFLNSSYPNGVLVNNIYIGSMTLSSNGVKTIETNGFNIISSNNNIEEDYGILLSSLNNITENGFTVGEPVDKDMTRKSYTNQFYPENFPDFFPEMAPLIDENIVLGDKVEEDRLLACYWDDWKNDIFDSWGFFYLYDLELGKYYFPLITPRNDNDGELNTQTFNAFGRTFTITHGYPVQGIFKFDISVADNKPFKFGAYGNMGSDGNEVNTDLTHTYTKGSTNLTLYYVKQEQDGSSVEILYSYFIPKKVSENTNPTYNLYNDTTNSSLMSKVVTKGLIVYFSKTNDVKEWIINDLHL